MHENALKVEAFEHILCGMPIDPIRLPVLAQQKEDENWRFRSFLKGYCRLDTEEIDERVLELTKRVRAEIDCTKCANCCKKIRPSLNDEDVDRIARRLGITRDELIEAHLEKDPEPGNENPWITRSAPCPFLKDDLCSIYDDRPGDCQGYPYLYEPEFTSRLMGIIERTLTCPIVFEVMEGLKRSVGYHDRRRR